MVLGIVRVPTGAPARRIVAGLCVVDVSAAAVDRGLLIRPGLLIHAVGYAARRLR